MYVSRTELKKSTICVVQKCVFPSYNCIRHFCQYPGAKAGICCSAQLLIPSHNAYDYWRYIGWPCIEHPQASRSRLSVQCLMIIVSRPSWPWSYGSWSLQLPMQSVPIATDVVSSNRDQGEVYSIMWSSLSVTWETQLYETTYIRNASVSELISVQIE